MRALHALAKVGEELYIDAQIGGLEFRTANSARSAFSSVAFQRNFFTDYDPDKVLKEASDSQGSQDFSSAKCKVAMKVS